MAVQNRDKLNWLQHNLPEGFLADARWLERHGYSRSLRNYYVHQGWLDQIGRGVYRRPVAVAAETGQGEGLRWQNVVVSLQTLLERPLAVGGRTALELQGFAHYLTAAGSREIHLYGNVAPPGWLSRLNLDGRFVIHNATKLFSNGMRGMPASAPGGPRPPSSGDPGDSHGDAAGLIRQTWGEREWPLIMSSPERAILELLDELPQRETFHQADVLMEGLRTLSPHRLQMLLADCRSVKVKRLFFWFSERHNHPWLNKLDRGAIDLGRGKRVLAPGGKLDPKYNITVPERLNGDF